MKKKPTPKPPRKPRAPRKTLRQRLEEALEKSHPGRVDSGRLSDGSSAWVTVRTGGMETQGALILEFAFEDNGEDIQEITIVKEIVQVVDQKIVFTTKPAPKEEKKS